MKIGSKLCPLECTYGFTKILPSNLVFLTRHDLFFLFWLIFYSDKHSDKVSLRLRKLGVDEWIVRLVQGMYSNARSHVRVGEGYSEEFEVKVGVHQGSVLSPLLFIIVLEALSREFRCGVPWEDLYADDLVIIAESLEECVRRLLTWKEAMWGRKG